MTPLKHALTLILGTQLLWSCGNDSPPPAPRLTTGGRCQDASQCASEYCQPMAGSVEGAMVCCAIQCAEGTQCDPSGGFCVQCSGPDCKEVPEQVGVRGLPLGAECQWNAECRDGSCRNDVEGTARCCEQGCTGDTICLDDGMCGCRDGTVSRGPCDGTGVGESGATVGQMGSGLGAGDPSLCGNGRSDPGEECDGDPSCTPECLSAVCGNKRLDSGEECEPPSSGECSSTCLNLGCGNGRLDLDEECEPPGMGTCGDDCSTWACGNNRLDPEEECEPPNTATCGPDCQEILCGNGRVDPPDEGCDPPLEGSCTSTCHPWGCGDSVITGSEECDPPLPGKCDGRCLLVSCGNGRVDSGEECDSPILCTAECTRPVCGNSRLDEGEECDPPEAQHCSSECATIECGNSRLDEGEACDPGLDSSTCSADCNLLSSSGSTYLYTFDADITGWALNISSPDELLDASTLAWNSAQGQPTVGALGVVIPFTDRNQKIEVKAMRSPALDLTGLKVKAKVRLLNGLAQGGESGAIKIFAKSGSKYDYASGPWTKLTAGQPWADVVLEASAPTFKPGEYVPNDVKEIGVEIATFNNSQQVTTAELAIDTVEIGQ